MDREATIDWFRELADVPSDIERFAPESRIMCYRSIPFFAWLAQADTAIHGTFHKNHPMRLQWTRTKDSLVKKRDGLYVVGEPAVGVFRGAASLVASGRLDSLIETIQARSIVDLLNQAEHLLQKGFLVGATVIAGGVLETHLKHLCAKHALTFQGEGSIGKYDGAIAQARNSGAATVYTGTLSKQVTAWGDLRNKAAHTPGEFEGAKDEVDRMIEGIRDFIERTTQ